MRIFACHLLNDYSGSPKVLMQLIKGWTENNIAVTVLTSSKRKGFLSGLDTVNYAPFWYQLAGNPFVRFIFLVMSQFFLLIKLLELAKKEDIIYINTVLPFGAAIAGKIKGCSVIYHVHETSIKPQLLKKFLFGCVKKFATDVVYVSNYLQRQENIADVKNHILYNAIEEEFYQIGKINYQSKHLHKNVLMICSLKRYKGVLEFVELASLNPAYDFKLVVNADQNEIEDFFRITFLPANLRIYPVQTNTHPFYSWADIVLNLSRTDEWIETFGLTILEGMAYGLPAIVPPIGGIAELVEENRNGALVDSLNLQHLSKRLGEILNNKNLYAEMEANSFSKINSFRENEFVKKSLAILQNRTLSNHGKNGNYFHILENKPK